MPFLALIIFVSILKYLGTGVTTDRIENLIKPFGIYAPIVFVIFMMTTNILPPIPVVPFWIVAIVSFPKPIACAAIIIANILGNTMNFLIARYLGEPAVKRLAGKDSLTKIQKFVGISDFKTFALIRFFGTALTDYISYAAGFSRLSLGKYVLATVLALTPLTLLAFVIISNGLTGNFAETATAFGTVYAINYGVTLLLPYIYIKNKHKFKNS